MKPRLLALGDGALTLEFGDSIDLALNAKVIAARDALAALKLDGISDMVPTWRSLTVHFDPLQLNREALTRHLLDAAQAPAQESALATRWQIPVVFGGEFGPDLAAVAQATRRSEAEIIEALCASELHVFLIGFLPGFPYLGELPDWLRLPRRVTPRAAVPANSLAIAGAQAAIYPWQSPGGWHLLGRTPVRLFDLGDASRPALLAPGDSVRFAPIGSDEFRRLTAAVAAREIDPSAWRAP
ncbi:MAG: 5-oxoprolinase subunit PxpB [Sulfuritalea sp.]|nr:5-oxoprolinase subunit PxpB [Sulfuritalea sp.]MDP1981074.1 5-oxoprolinase subunit PxpB [Sulfuritalea sp.]